MSKILLRWGSRTANHQRTSFSFRLINLQCCICIPTFSKGSSICFLLIPQQATYHLHPGDPDCLLHPPCSSPSLSSFFSFCTPSFQDSIHLISCMFYTPQLKRFVDISFYCALKYGFASAHTHKHTGHTPYNLLLIVKLSSNHPPPVVLVAGVQRTSLVVQVNGKWEAELVD